MSRSFFIILKLLLYFVILLLLLQGVFRACCNWRIIFFIPTVLPENNIWNRIFTSRYIYFFNTVIKRWRELHKIGIFGEQYLFSVHLIRVCRREVIVRVHKLCQIYCSRGFNSLSRAGGIMWHDFITLWQGTLIITPYSNTLQVPFCSRNFVNLPLVF